MENKNKNTIVKMVSAPAAAIETPIFKSVTNKDYILYGQSNDYPSILREMMNQSSLHNAILKKKADMTSGAGFDDDEMTAFQKQFVKNINGSETLDQIVYKNAFDLVLNGGFCFLVTWSRDRTKIARVQYMDWSKVRRVKELDDDSDIAKRQVEGLDYYLISSDWTQERKQKYKPKLVQGFSTEYNKEVDETTQLVYVPMYSPGCEDTYPMPDYQACSTYIAIDTEIASFHLNSCKNGFSPSMMINLIGVPSDEEMKQMQRKLEEQYAGSANASKVILTVSEDESQVPVITPLTLNASDERYKDLAEMVKEQIVIGHRASNPAVGVSTAGKLSTTNEIIEAEAAFQHNVISNYQKLIEDAYNRILFINDIDGELKLKHTMTFNLDEVVEDDAPSDNNKNIITE